ncbi:hypothetical protein SLE2022_111180 [Rubroshorea leprosula]
MLGFSRLTCISSPRIPGISQRPTYLLPRESCSPFLKTQFRIPSSPSRLALFAQSGDNDDLIKESAEKVGSAILIRRRIGDRQLISGGVICWTPPLNADSSELVLTIIFAKVERKQEKSSVYMIVKTRKLLCV